MSSALDQPPGSTMHHPRLHILCPNCLHPAKGTHKRQLSNLVTELSCRCTNSTCGGAFVFVGEVHRWLHLPAKLDPRLQVPLSPTVQRRQLAEALQRLPSAAVPRAGEIDATPRDCYRADPFAESVPDLGHWTHLFP